MGESLKDVSITLKNFCRTLKNMWQISTLNKHKFAINKGKPPKLDCTQEMVHIKNAPGSGKVKPWKGAFSLAKSGKALL